jgi:hypothetical protein
MSNGGHNRNKPRIIPHGNAVLLELSKQVINSMKTERRRCSGVSGLRCWLGPVSRPSLIPNGMVMPVYFYCCVICPELFLDVYAIIIVYGRYYSGTFESQLRPGFLILCKETTRFDVINFQFRPLRRPARKNFSRRADTTGARLSCELLMQSNSYHKR